MSVIANMTDLSVEDYSEKCIVVRGDTKPHKDQLKQLGGKWNSRLRDGPGWIFPKRIEDDVLAFVESGNVPDDESKTDIIGQLEKMFSYMDTNSKLQFVARVATLANAKKVKKKPVRKTKSKFRKPKYESDEDVIVESSEEEEIPRRKRLLK